MHLTSNIQTNLYNQPQNSIYSDLHNQKPSTSFQMGNTMNSQGSIGTGQQHHANNLTDCLANNTVPSNISNTKTAKEKCDDILKELNKLEIDGIYYLTFKNNLFYRSNLIKIKFLN